MVDVGELVSKVVPHEPPGDPGRLRAAADTWNHVASALRSSVDDADSRLAALAASWQGSAKTAYSGEWRNLVTAVHEACDELNGVAGALRDAAAQLEHAKHAYKVALVAVGVTAAVGIAATIITFGASDAVAGAAVAAETGVAVAVAAEASTAAALAMATAVNLARTIAVRFVVYLGVDLAAQAGASAVVFPDHDPFGHLDLSQAVIVAGGLAVPGAVGGGLGRQVFVGGVVGAGTDSAAQLITKGSIDPAEALFTGGLTAVGTGAVVVGGRVFSNIMSRFAATGNARRQLLDQLVAAEVKHSPDDVLLIGRDTADRIVFLEKGNTKAGLQHIIERHAGEFEQMGIPVEKIPDMVFTGAAKGKIVGSQGTPPGRPIYEFMFDGNTYRLAITVSDNGFIIGANPVGR